MKLTCMRGYSGSGKSHKAREIAKETGAVVVNRDYLRKMILGDWWTGDAGDEAKITVAEDNLVEQFLRAGSDVIVDATHLYPPYLRKWAKLAQKLGADFEVVDVHADADICVARDRARPDRQVGQQTIQKQMRKAPVYRWPTVNALPRIEIEPYVPPEYGYSAIMVDIDGTLAHIPEGGRSPFDYTRVREDLVDTAIARLVNDHYYNTQALVLVVSGRDDTCFDDTYTWLRDNDIRFDRLLMRPAEAKDANGNKLPDWIVKLNIFNEHIRDHYKIRFVLDDRNQVVEMWRKLGLKCLQVAEGNF